MKLVYVSSVSATFELENKQIYYSKEKYDVYLNNKLVLKGINTNVFSLYDLLPNTRYEVRINDKIVVFNTLSVSEVISTKSIAGKEEDVTEKFQKIIDEAKENALIIVEKGVYNITSLLLKSDMTLYIKKGALLSCSINESDYKEIEGEVSLPDGSVKQVGTWEGDPRRMKLSILSAFEQKNIHIVGQGTIDGNAQLSTWWVDYKNRPYARPHMIFLNHCENVFVQGIDIKNSPQWTVHPFFSKNVGFYDFKITNPKISPNTDGINPQCCNKVTIIGVHFSVGDDCIAIKSGKMYIGKKYKQPCENILIRNCLMQFGHGAVVLGSEMSGGIKNLTVERCYFDHTDRGLRIKTRRGRGDTAIIDNVEFNDIYMDNVLTPLVINMFYFCDPDGKTEYVWSKEKLPVDDRTPYLGKFTFNNINAINVEVCSGYFYGLPEQPIKEISINNSSFSFKENAESGTPAMMSFAEECLKRGFVFRNVKTVNINNVSLTGNEGEFMFLEGNEVINRE